MSTRVEHNVSTINWIVDPNSYSQNSGRTIDWDQVTATDENGNKVIESGRIVSETPTGLVPRNLGITDGTNPYPAIGILLESINQSNRVRAISGQAVITGGIVYGNLLPDDGDANFDAWITELDENGTGIVTENFQDDRVS